MPRSFRQSQFRRSSDVGEDVNPSAYIVNLADCMLVLACGFLVAVISAFDMNLSDLEQLDSEQMEEVTEEAVTPEEIENGGGYVAAGTVYMDPNTGVTYWVKNAEVESATEEESGSESADTSASGSSAASASASDTSNSQSTSPNAGE